LESGCLVASLLRRNPTDFYMGFRSNNGFGLSSTTTTAPPVPSCLTGNQSMSTANTERVLVQGHENTVCVACRKALPDTGVGVKISLHKASGVAFSFGRLIRPWDFFSCNDCLSPVCLGPGDTDLEP